MLWKGPHKITEIVGKHECRVDLTNKKLSVLPVLEIVCSNFLKNVNIAVVGIVLKQIGSDAINGKGLSEITKICIVLPPVKSKEYFRLVNENSELYKDKVKKVECIV